MPANAVLFRRGELTTLPANPLREGESEAKRSGTSAQPDDVQI